MKRIPLLFLALAPALAADPAAEPFHLVISHRQVTEPVSSPEPATVKNVVAIINRRYPQSTVAMVGVEDVVLPDIVIDWPKAGPDPRAVLRALAVASHWSIQIDSNQGPGFYVLSPDEAREGQDVQVFNLKNYLQPGADRLREQLRAGKAQLKVWSERYEDKHPKMQDIRGQIQETQSLLDQIVGTDEEADRKVKQITDLIGETVAELAPDSHAPQFYFHRQLSVLVVVGDRRAVDAAKKVVAALQ